MSPHPLSAVKSRAPALPLISHLATVAIVLAGVALALSLPARAGGPLGCSILASLAIAAPMRTAWSRAPGPVELLLVLAILGLCVEALDAERRTRVETTRVDPSLARR
jgi:hypothetical protein